MTLQDHDSERFRSRPLRVPEYQKTDIPYLSTGVERDIHRAIKVGKHVQISITPHYENSGSGIPTTIE